MTKRQKKQIIAVVVTLFCVAFLIFTNSSSKTSTPFKSSTTPTYSESQSQVINEISPSEASSSQEVLGETNEQDMLSENQSEGQENYMVTKVVDGDTIEVDMNGENAKIRIIGIDTPETVDPRKPVQCFGKEASSKAKETLNGKYVTLVADETQGNTDKYKRYLRYVFLPDGTNYGLFMISNGFAHEYTYDSTYKYQSEYKSAEVDARNNNRGLWSPDTCSGNK